MYYASQTPVGAVSQDKPGNIYIPGQAPTPFAATAQVGPPAGFAPGGQQVLPNGLTAPTARYAHHSPQAYAVVSSPAGHPAYAPAVYSSMPYHPGVAAAIPTSSHAATAAAYHIPTAQFHPGGIGYHHQTAALAAATTGRSAHHPSPQPAPVPPQHYALQQPVQAGAPLFAAGYTPLPAGAMATAAGTPPGATRTIPLGPTPMATATAGAGFPPGFAAFPGAASSEGTVAPPQMAYAPAGKKSHFDFCVCRSLTRMTFIDVLWKVIETERTVVP